MEGRFEHFCGRRVNPRLFCRMGGALYSPGSEGKPGSQDTSGFIYGKPSPLHRMIKRKFGGRGLPSFPVTSSSLGTQFVKLSSFHRPLCSAEADPVLQSGSQAGGSRSGMERTRRHHSRVVPTICSSSLPLLLTPNTPPSRSSPLCPPLTHAPTSPRPPKHQAHT